MCRQDILWQYTHVYSYASLMQASERYRDILTLLYSHSKKEQPRAWYINWHGHSHYFKASIHQFIEFKCSPKPCNNIHWPYK